MEDDIPVFEENLYSQNSHKKCLVTCDFQKSEKCSKTSIRTYRDVLKNKERNNNNYICFDCSRNIKNSSVSNPNSKYNYDMNFLENIDTEEKAYLLGWIASDGSINEGTINIFINEKDIEILEKLKNIICRDFPTKSKKNNLVGFSINCKKIVSDCLKHLKLENSGKKSNDVSFPELKEEYLYWSFIRGLFDGDGCICKRQLKNSIHARVQIASISKKMKEGIRDFCKIPCYIGDQCIEFSCYNGLDFAEKMYKYCKDTDLYLKRKFDKYLEIIETRVTNYPLFKCVKTDKNAIIPSKSRMSDSGMDITVIKLLKKNGNVEFYDTGLIIEPEFGYYFELVPRSSISKTGYMLANSIGIIDTTYRGNLIVALVKIDKDAKDIELPCRIAQMIPRKVIHMNIIEVNTLEETDRGDGGFGSTGV